MQLGLWFWEFYHHPVTVFYIVGSTETGAESCWRHKAGRQWKYIVGFIGVVLTPGNILLVLHRHGRLAAFGGTVSQLVLRNCKLYYNLQETLFRSCGVAFITVAIILNAKSPKIANEYQKGVSKGLVLSVVADADGLVLATCGRSTGYHFKIQLESRSHGTGVFAGVVISSFVFNTL